MKYSLITVLSIILTGCSASHYREKADEEVYEILKKTEQYVYGKNRGFTIDTKYSSRSPSEISSQEILNTSRKGGTVHLSIEQALNFAVNNSREYQTQKERLYLTALALTGERNRFSPIGSSTGSANITNQSDGEVPLRGQTTQSISQSLLAGGNYSLSLANDLLRFFSGDPRRSASSVITLNIVQPLLRGRGRDIAAERLTQATRDVVYAIRDFNQFQNEFSRDIVITYLNLLEQKQRVKNQHENYLSRKQNTEYLRARSVDRASPQEVSDSEQGELQAKDSWINAKSSYQTALDNFKLTLGLPTSTQLKLNDKELKKLEQRGLHSLSLTPRRAFNLSLKHRLPLLNDIDRFEDSKRQVVVAADGLKTQIDLVTSASLRSTDNSYTNFNFNNVATEIGVEVNLPINRTNERNNYRSSLIRFESQIRSLSNSFDSLNNLIERRIREIQQFKQSYEIQKGAVELAKKRVEGNKLRFKAGNIIFRRLSESQDALIDAQNAVTAALIDYQRARLQLYTDIGILDTSKREFWLKSNPTSY